MLRNHCYYGKVYSFDLVIDSIINNKFDKALIDMYLEYDIQDDFTHVRFEDFNLIKFASLYPDFKII